MKIRLLNITGMFNSVIWYTNIMGQTNDYIMSICGFFIKNMAVRSNRKDWLELGYSVINEPLSYKSVITERHTCNVVLMY